MKKQALALSVVTLALGVSAAYAADIVRPVYKAPPAPVHQTYWTGCYVGGNVGYGWAPTNWNTPAGVDLASHSANGFTGGGQVGCDYEMNCIVVGFHSVLLGVNYRF